MSGNNKENSKKKIVNNDSHPVFITGEDNIPIFVEEFPPSYFALLENIMASVPQSSRQEYRVTSPREYLVENAIIGNPGNAAEFLTLESNDTLLKNVSRINSQGRESSANEMEQELVATSINDTKASSEPSAREVNEEEIHDAGTNVLRECSLNDIQIIESWPVPKISRKVEIGKIEVKRILPKHINLTIEEIQTLPNYDEEPEICGRDENADNRVCVYQVINPDFMDLTDNPIDENSPDPEPISRTGVEQHRRKHRSTSADNGGRIKAKVVSAKSRQASTKEENNPVRTRYGRITKLPKNFEVDYVMQQNRKGLNEPKFHRDDDESFKCTSNVSVTVDRNVDKDANTSATVAKEKCARDQKYFGNHRCPNCNKVYLGKRLMNHFLANPSHNVNAKRNVNEMTNQLSLYKFFVEKVKQTPEDQRSELFLMEITDLVQQLQSRRSRLVRDTSVMHVVGEHSSRVLGIPQGNYIIDANAIDADPEIESMVVEDMGASISEPPTRLDYNISLDIDDSLGVTKLNLPDNLIPSEESFLRTVDDLVEQGIADLQKHDVIDHTQNPVINYDHATDNAVEATTDQQSQLLGMCLDLFQFTDN